LARIVAQTEKLVIVPRPRDAAIELAQLAIGDGGATSSFSPMTMSSLCNRRSLGESRRISIMRTLSVSPEPNALLDPPGAMRANRGYTTLPRQKRTSR
jgi:hypothetical protein